MTGPALRIPSLACATLLALGGCAVPTTAAFDARMAGFVGRPEAEVVAALGVPVRTYEAGGLRFLQYESRRLVSYPGAYPYAGWRYGGFGAFPVVESRECDLTFTLRNDLVQGFTRRGGDCRALPPTVGEAAPAARGGAGGAPG
jgi:hypothetical protein